MLRVPLRWRILSYASALVVALLAATLVFVNYQAQNFVSRAIAADFDQGRRSIQRAEQERLTNLRLAAQNLGAFPRLAALFDIRDVGTILDFLETYRQENRRISILIALDSSGRVLARTDMAVAEPLSDAEATWVRSSLEGGSAIGILATPRGVFRAAAAPAAAGRTVFGFIVAGASVDNALAEELAGITRDDVVLVGDRVLGSTISTSRLPWRTQQEWASAIGKRTGPQNIDITGESFAALPVPLTGESEPSILAIQLRSRDRALEPYKQIQNGLLWLGVFVAAVGIVVSWIGAQRLTASIGELVEGTKRVAEGDFDTQLDVRSNDEIGDLAQSFNGMMRGLRERADMQKFVSQSTVEMIQADKRRDSAGERRLLTIFFSDVRGFTTLAQDRPPEDVVRILNACLSLQAECVQKFAGDVDKFVGDSVVALFSGDDSAFQAIRCAVEIVKALDAYKDAHPQEEAPQVGIGIVTGEVILGSIGSEDRRDFTVVGSNVNLCARLCSLAKPREILLAESSYQRVKDLVAAERLKPQQVKGFPEPIPVYRIRLQ